MARRRATTRAAKASRKRKSDSIEEADEVVRTNSTSCPASGGEQVESDGEPGEVFVEPTRKRTMTGRDGRRGGIVSFEKEFVDSDSEEEEERDEEEGEGMTGGANVEDDRPTPSDLPRELAPSGDGTVSRLSSDGRNPSAYGFHSEVSFATSSVAAVSTLGVSTGTASLAQKLGNVKAAVRKTVFRFIKFLGKAGSKELDWDQTIANTIYSHLNMTTWTDASKKMWWEGDDNAVPRCIAETLSVRRSEVTQGMHKRFLGK